MMDWDYGGAHTTAAGWVLMTLTSVIALAALVAIAYLIFRAVQPTLERGDDEAQRLLDERFARGDLDIEEYQRRRALLQSSRRS
jgi:putative membrane protein